MISSYLSPFSNDADRRAAVDEDNIDDRVKTWVKQLREATFRIENIIDIFF
jgi:disease resistance protein RPM1